MINIKLIKKYDLFILLLSLMVISLILPYFGGSLNNFVVSVNSGKMPVYTNLLISNTNTHFTFNKFGKVNWGILSDIINIGNTYYSIGDLMIYCGLFSILFFGVVVLLQGFKLEKERRKYLKRDFYE
ncbi:MAG: DUF5317 domain-containing protein [Chlorobi bacterium]|nr:DUF5317 domain-containing protein [Chlorobiota bacterium]